MRPAGKSPFFLLLLLAVCAGGCNMAAQQANMSGVTMFQQGNYQKADEYFRQAIHNDPANADSYYNLGANYQKLAKLTNQPVDVQQAESYYQQCLARNPNHADCYRALAVLLAEQNRAPEAFALLQRWSTVDPRSPEPYIQTARLSDEFGDKARAQEALVYALRNDPNNARALAAMGKLREDAGDYAQAMVNYQRSLASNASQPAVARVAMMQSRVDPNQQMYGPNGGRFAAQPTYPGQAPVQRY